ncbi:MAG: SRPBCC domain-containing protein, partial [Planctomycetota bacterium]
MTRSIKDQREFDVPVATVFELLIKPSAICQWWSAKQAIVLPKPGGYWSAIWGDDIDDPDYVTIARILEFERPNRLVLGDYEYHAKTGGLPFDAEFVTTFSVSASAKGAILQVEQRGFPTDAAADEYYAGCIEGWQR